MHHALTMVENHAGEYDCTLTVLEAAATRPDQHSALCRNMAMVSSVEKKSFRNGEKQCFYTVYSRFGQHELTVTLRILTLCVGITSQRFCCRRILGLLTMIK